MDTNMLTNDPIRFINGWVEQAQRTSGWSMLTFEAYRQDLKSFQDVLASFGCTLSKASKDDVLRAVNVWKSRGLRTTSIARYISTAKRFYTSLVACNILKKNPLEGLAVPMVSWKKRDSPRLSREEYQAFLGATCWDLGPHGIRDMLMMKFLCIGIRTSNLCLLSLEDLDLDGRRIIVRGKKRIQGYEFDTVLESELRHYLSEVRPGFAGSQESNLVFLSRRTGAMHRAAVWQRMQRYARDAQIDKHVTAADLYQAHKTYVSMEQEV